jgi:hypothetical protein
LKSYIKKYITRLFSGYRIAVKLVLEKTLQQMQKIALLYILPVLSIIIILVRLPEADRWLRNRYVNAPFITTAILGGSTILTHLITVVAPLRRYESWERNKWGLIDNIATGYLEHELFRNAPIVANIMIPKRVFYCSREPLSTQRSFIRRLSARFFVRRLDVIWLSSVHALNRQFKITTRQGVTGKAYSSGRTMIMDIPGSIHDLNLTEQQKALLSGNGFVASAPIFLFDRKYNCFSHKVIGVVTFSCSLPGSERVIEHDKNRQLIREKITSFSTICSFIL